MLDRSNIWDKRILGVKKMFALKKFFESKKFGHKKFWFQKCPIYCGILLTLHDILLPRSGVMGFVSGQRREERRKSSIGQN